MFDYEYEISMALRRRLRPVIKGKIVVKIRDNTLQVKIINPLGRVWLYYVDDFAYRLMMGQINIDSLAMTIIELYKRYVLNYYLNQMFYQD